MVFPALVAAGLLFAAGARERPREARRPVADAPHVEGEVLVGFRYGAGERERSGLRARLGARAVGRLGRSIERIELAPGLTTAQAIARHAHDPAIRFIEPNYLVHADELPDDPRFSEQYGLHNAGQTGGRAGADIDVEPVWRTSTGSHDVLVAILDTGIDRTHPDLAANIWTNPGEIPGNGVDDDANGYVDDVHGWDFRNDDNDSKDDNGHGTHVAGIVGAVGDNGIGVSGVSWKVSLVGLKFLGSNGVGTTAGAVEAVDYARRIGARVTNNSWGGAPFSQALYESIQAATASGVLFVASAGNDGRDTDLVDYYPAGYEDDGIVAVAMADHDGVLVSGSNYGAASVDLAAPGLAVLSTVPGGLYRLLGGTSMAAPHVSGAAGLLLSIAPDLSPADLRRLFVERALPDPGLARVTLSGGRLNVRRMLDARDTVAPGAIDDLRVDTATSDAVVLRWTAPGDDGQLGVARRYELRRSEPPGLAPTLVIAGLPRPGPSGALESFEVRGLEPDRTYAFSLVAFDEWSNAGPPSNVASATSASAPSFDSTPQSFDVSLFEGESTERTLALHNLGAGPLDWQVLRPVVPSPGAPYPPAEEAWLAVDALAGRLPAGDGAAVRLSIDARQLDSGVYESSVDIATNDPGRPLVAHAVRLLVQGAPIVAVEPPALELDEVFTGTPATATLTIRNRGSEALHVTDIALAEGAAAAEITIEPRALTVPPHGSALVRVVVGASAAGAIETALVIESDAPNAPRLEVPLSARALPPPGISVDPAELRAVSDGALVHRTLAITNPGESPLEIALSFQDPSKATAATQVLVNGGFEIGNFSGWKATSNGISELMPWTVAPAGGGFFLDSNPYEGRFDAMNGFDGDAGLEYDLVQTFVLPADAVRAELSYRDRIQFDGSGRFASAPRLYRTTIEDAAGAVLLEVAREEVRTHFTPFTDRGWRERRADLAPFAGRTLRLHVHQSVPETDRGPALLELDDFRIDVTAFPDWVQVEPHRATIAPGATLPIDVVFDPGARGDASLGGTLRIDTNVPGTPTVRVGLGLAVGGEPDIAVHGPVVHTESTLEFGDRFATTRHVLPVAEPPAAGGTLVVQAEGNFSQWSEFASVLLEGEALGTLGRSGVTCSTTTKAFPLDAALLEQVTADGSVEVQVRNHPDASPYCTRNRHRVALEYRPAAGPIDFDTVPPGAAAVRTIALVNRGTRPLAVHSISTDAPFEVAPAVLELPPFGETQVELTFRPASTGALEGRLAIESDDPDTPRIELALAGRGGAPAALVVEPVRLDAALESGTTDVRALTLTNPGDVPLHFDLALETEEASTPTFERLGDSPTPLTCVVADAEHGAIYAQTLEGTSFFRYDADEAGWVLLAAAPIDSGEGCGAALLSGKIYTAYVEDSRLGVYDVENDAWTTMPAPIGHTANVATDGVASLYQLRNARLAVLDLDSLAVRALAAPPFDYDPRGVLRYHGGKLYAHQGHAGVGKVGFASYDTAANAWTVLPVLPGPGVLAGELDPRRRTYVTYGDVWLYRYSLDADAWVVLDNPYFSSVTGGIGALRDPVALYFVEGRGGRGFARLIDRPPLARPSLSRGTLEPGESVEVEVALSALDRAAGGHEAVIVVDSDDGSAPRRTIPVAVQVQGVPDLALHGEGRSVSSTRDYEVSAATTLHRLRVDGHLDGPARLELGATGDFGDRGEIAVARVNGVALGLLGQAATVCQTLSTAFLVDGLASQVADGTLELELANEAGVESYCPVNRHQVRLTWGTAVRRLDLGRVVSGAEASTAFTIENRGDAALHVSSIASDDPRFRVEPQSVELAPRGTERVVVSFLPDPAGATSGTLTIESDDPDTPRLTLPLAGEGIAPPSLSATPRALTADVPQGDVVWRKLAVANGGSGPLELSLSVEPAGSAFVALDPTTLLVKPGTVAEVTVRLDARGLPVGQHAAEIRLASNDPAAPLSSVPVTLRVVGVPRLALHGDPVIVDSEERFIRFDERTSHVLAVQRRPAGGAVIELTVEGDYHSALDRTATAITEGRRLGVVAGTIYDCAAETGAFALSPAELAALATDGVVQVEVQNSQYVDPRICPVNRHAVRLRYDSVLERVDFGTRFAGSGGERSIVIENTGTAALSISSIVTEGSAFAAAATSLELAPGANAPLAIEFLPDVTGTYTGLLRLLSDDPAAPRIEIPLTGTAVEAPRISVEPPALALALARGEATTVELSISNSGPGALDFTLGVAADSATFVTLDPAHTAGALGPGETAIVAVRIDAAGLPPSRRDASIEIASNDPASPLVVVPLELTITGAPALRLGGPTVTATSEASFTAAGAVTSHRLALPAPPGGSGVLELATEGDYGAEDETARLSVEGLELGSTRDAPQDCAASSTSFNLGAAALAALAADGALEADVRNSRSVGSFCAANRHALTLRYPARVESLDFGEVWSGATRRIDVVVENGGTDVLHVSSIESTRSDVVVSRSTLDLQPGARTTVGVSFTPASEGALDAELRVTSNDPAAPLLAVPVRGAATRPPALEIDASPLEVVLEAGAEQIVALEIGNTGGAALAFGIVVPEAAAQWLSVEPAAGAIGAGSTQSIALRIDATQLAAGPYAATLALTSNDPLAPYVTLPVALDCRGAPHLALNDTDGLDFGTVLVGRARSLELELRNEGRDVLHVGAVGSGDPAFTPSSQPLAIAPGAAGTLRVTFAPLAARAYSSTLVVASDDPAAPLVELDLRGDGQDPPRLELTPPALEARLPSGGRAESSLLLTNAGPSTLEYTIGVTQVEGAPLPAGALEVYFESAMDSPAAADRPPAAGPPMPLTCVVGDAVAGVLYAQGRPGRRFLRFDAATGTWDELAAAPLDSGIGGGAALLDGRIYTSYALQSEIGVYDIAADAWTTIQAPLASTSNIASDLGDSLYLVRANFGRRLDPQTGDVALVPAPPFGFSQSGGLRAAGGLLYGHAGGTSASFGSYDPASGAWTPLASSPGPARLGAAIDGAAERYVALGSDRTLYRYALDLDTWDELPLPWPTSPSSGLAWLPSPVSAIYVPETEGREMGRVVSRPSFLVVDRRRGSVPPGGSVELPIGFDAARLGTGELAGAIVVTTNDLAGSVSVVPVTLSVSDAPHLSLLGDTVRHASRVDFDAADATTLHVLSTPASPAGRGTLHTKLVGSFAGPDRHATVSIEGSPVGLAGGPGQGCVTVETEHEVGAADLAAFTRDGAVEVEVRNGKGSSAACDESSHAVELSYRPRLVRVEFGPVVLGAAREVEITLENDGTLPLALDAVESDHPELTVGEWPPVLGPGESAALRVALAPLGTGAVSGTLTIVSNDPGVPRLELPWSGEGLEAPSLAIDPPAIEAAVSEGGSILAALEISNAGASELRVEAVPDAPFVRPGATHLDLAPGAAAPLELRLDATDLVPGAHAATLVLSTNDPARTRVEVPVRLEVAGASNLLIAGAAEVVESVRSFQGSGAATIHGFALPASARAAAIELEVEGDFGLSDEAATLSAEGRVLGALGGLGPDCVTGTLELTLDAPLVRELAADGVLALDVRNSPRVDAQCPLNRHRVRVRHHAPLAALAFGDVSVGDSAERQLTLLNVGSRPLGVATVVASAPAIVVGHAGPAVIAPGDRLAFAVTFTPSDVLPFAALLTVTSDDPDSPVMTLPVSGRGVEPPRFEVEPRELDVVLSDGDHALEQLILHNAGATPLEFAITEQPQAPAFLTYGPRSGMVPPGDALGVTLRVDAGALPPGDVEVLLEIATNDPLERIVRVPLRVRRLGRPDIALRGPRVEVRSSIVYTDIAARTMHTLPIEVPPAGAAMLELVADGDYGGLRGEPETATVSVDARVLGTQGNAGIDCIPVPGSYTLDPAELERHAADGFLEVEVQNSENVNIFCARNLHTLVLSYDAPLSRVDLGTVLVGGARAATIPVRNDGHGELRVEAVSCDDPRVQIPVGAFVVAQGATVDIPFVFAPTDPSPLEATIEIVSNDLDEPVSRIVLASRVLTPPAIAALEPSEIEAVLPQGPPLVERRTLRLRNTGAGDLAWSAQPVDLDEPGYLRRDSDDPDGAPFVWQDARAGGAALALTGDDDVSPPQPLGFDFPFYGGRFGAVHVSSDGWLSFSDARPSPSNAQTLPSANPSVPANLVAPFWDDLHARGQSRLHVRGDASAFVVQWSGMDRFAGGAELTFQAILYPSGVIAFQYLKMSGRTDSATIGIQNGARDAGVLVAPAAGYVHDGLRVELTPAASWISLDPQGGALGPGEAATVAVDLTAVALERGRHTSRIVVSTNDPAHGVLDVPVTLDVDHVPLDRFALDASTAHPASRARALRARLQLPPAYDPSAIDVGSVRLAGVLAPRSGAPPEIADTDGDGVSELLLEFDRAALLRLLPAGEHVPVFVSGRLADEQWFAGSTEIAVPRRVKSRVADRRAGR